MNPYVEQLFREIEESRVANEAAKAAYEAAHRTHMSIIIVASICAVGIAAVLLISIVGELKHGKRN